MEKTIEVEIKTLLGTREAAESLVSRMREKYPPLRIIRQGKQLNHYFHQGDIYDLGKNLEGIIPPEKLPEWRALLDRGVEHSVRTRKTDSEVLFIVKATLDETSSSNGTARAEFEAAVSIPFEALDAMILQSGYLCQAKWSRERQEYLYKGYTVAIDKNAGYGYLAEFERVVGPDSDLELIKEEIRAEMHSLGVVELQQDRLARMFDFYNAHWEEYYGTDRTFVIE